MAIFTSIYQELLPLYLDWIEARAMHPASRPTFIDFFLCGRQSSMSGRQLDLIKSSLPQAVVKQLDDVKRATSNHDIDDAIGEVGNVRPPRHRRQ